MSALSSNFQSLCGLRKFQHSLITTPIFYVNASPHIGHLYSAVLADAAHRWQILKGAEPAVFSTGTDEHGLKIQKAALSQGCTPRDLCDAVSSKFKALFDTANISYTDYIRTTEKRHTDLVANMWNRLYDNGYIYKGKYEGWYSVPDETFLSASQIRDGEEGNKYSLESGHVLEWSSEDNYLFRLSAFRDQLLSWVQQEPSPIVPDSARHQVVSWLSSETLEDLSVSRPRSRLTWGIPVPNDSSHTIYVWLDALFNYLTVSGYPDHTHCWPATAHIVGKDILRFHAIYWPAFLMASGLSPPQKIISHAHWTLGMTKMSKSKGNVIDPLQQISKYGVDPLRYFLLKEGSLQHDGDYSEQRVTELLHSDLANTLGNLLQRVMAQKLHPWGEHTERGFRSGDLQRLHLQDGVTRDLLCTTESLPGLIDKHYEAFEFSRGISYIMDCLYQTNQYLEHCKPWVLAGDPTKWGQLETVLTVAIATLKTCNLLLYPIMPQSSQEALRRLGVGSSPQFGRPPLFSKIPNAEKPCC